MAKNARTRGRGIMAAKTATRDRQAADILAYIGQHQPCRMTSISERFAIDAARAKKLLQHLKTIGKAVPHGRTRGRAVWCLPDYPVEDAMSAADAIWRATGAVKCATCVDPRALRKASELRDDDEDDERAHAFRHVLVSADQFRATIPANAVRSVFDLARRCAA